RAVGENLPHPKPTILTVATAERVTVLRRVAQRRLVAILDADRFESRLQRSLRPAHLAAHGVQAYVDQQRDLRRAQRLHEALHPQALVAHAVDPTWHLTMVAEGTRVRKRAGHKSVV